MNRRAFAKAISALAMSGALVNTGVGAYPGEYSDQRRTAWALLVDGCRAPSSHNSQPWQIQIRSAHEWLVCPAPDRLLPVVDPEQRECWQSIGAFIVALEVAAAAHALVLDWRWSTEATGGAVELRFFGGGQRSNASLPSLRQRCTLRQSLIDFPQCVNRVNRCREGLEGLHFVPMATDGGVLIGSQLMAANRIQARSDPVWQELKQWIRWHPDDGQRRPTGITTEMMELPWFSRQWVAAFYGDDDVVSPAFREASLSLVSQQVREGAGWLLYTSSTNTRHDWLMSGIQLMRFWLRSVPVDLALHPMSQLVEVSACRQQTERDLGLGHLQLVARLGGRRYPSAPVSPRLAPNHIVQIVE